MTDTSTITESFSLFRTFADGRTEQLKDRVGAREALHAAYHYTHAVSALTGLTQRVIITDGGDCIVFEWKHGEGVVFPAGYND